MQSIQVQLVRQKAAYEIHIGRGLLQHSGELIRRALGSRVRRIAVISNRRIFDLYGAELTDSIQASDFSTSTLLLPEGERFKTFHSLTTVVNKLAELRFERDDAVVALGGGVIGDIAGFAAAVYLRGIALVQAPTSLLAQVDSAVGGKNGINLASGKNLVGTFYQPRVVLVDTEVLNSLPRRELVSGFCEIVKQAIVANRPLFAKTQKFLKRFQQDPAILQSDAMEALIALHCAFKASVVAHDERESTSREDERSRKILNFGHTVGHALEAAGGYKRFRHGEAVGYGMLVAGAISKNLGLLNVSELESMSEAVRLCGTLPPAADMNEQSVLDALSHDKKTSGGHIKWVLIEGIGKPRIVDGGLIRERLLRHSLRQGLRNFEGQS